MTIPTFLIQCKESNVLLKEEVREIMEELKEKDFYEFSEEIKEKLLG